jgi:phosphate transport system substrate-binding protein
MVIGAHWGTGSSRSTEEIIVHRQRQRGSKVPWMVGVAIAMVLTAGSAGRAQEATPAASASSTPTIDFALLSGTIVADGSSTVWLITAEAAERFAALAPVIVEVEVSGTSGGFRRFCAGESDLQNASRPITSEERAACEAAGVHYEVFPLGFDGVTVAVNPANTWAHCLTVEQLRALWDPEALASHWRQLDPAWPDMEIELYGPGPDSGTFDYFTEVILGETGRSRTDYVPSENDLDLVEGVASQPNALGYFGFAYYEADAHRLRAVAVDAGNGCVTPTPETIANGSYAPLSRPLYLYVNRDRLERPEVREFLRFALNEAEDVVRTVGYVPLPEADYAANQAHVQTLLGA